MGMINDYIIPVNHFMGYYESTLLIFQVKYLAFCHFNNCAVIMIISGCKNEFQEVNYVLQPGKEAELPESANYIRTRWKQDDDCK